MKTFHESAIGSFKCRRHRKDCYTSEGRAHAAMHQILAEIKASPHVRDKLPCRAYFDEKCGFWHLTSQPGKGQPMPYAKWGPDSDVFLFSGVAAPPDDDVHVIVCCGCLLARDDPDDWLMSPSFDFKTREGILSHLRVHLDAGHIVPESAVERIRSDDWLA